jgi:chromosomal replication initiator protein
MDPFCGCLTLRPRFPASAEFLAICGETRNHASARLRARIYSVDRVLRGSHTNDFRQLFSHKEQVNAAVSDELEHIWTQVRAELSAAIDEPIYRIWLEPLKAVDMTAANLTIAAPRQTHSWVRERFGRVLQTSVAAVLGPDVTVDIVESSRASGQPERTDPRASSTKMPTSTPRPTQAALGNPKLTFDQFVIGDSNRLAHAAALTVSELPAQAYNPLFICGPPGVGKTHLLQSVATFMAAYNPALHVRCTTGESFTNDFLSALGSGRLETFKANFRHVDVLLIDDGQFLERKTKTEE